MTREPDPPRRPQELLEKAASHDPEPPRPPPDAGGPPANRRFLVFGGLELHRADRLVTCRVRLRRGDVMLTGEAMEMDTASGTLRAAARAVLSAAESAVPGVRLGLHAITSLDLFGQPHVAVRVEAADPNVPRQIWKLSGIAYVEYAEADAACLAVLGAVDRWLGGLRRGGR